MAQLAFYFDGTRCTGCKTCVFACKDKNNLDVGMAYRRVWEYTGGTTEKGADGTCTTSCFSYYTSVSCNHCDKPICMANCPQGAISKDDETGLMAVDAESCIGCGTCVNACPYGAPKVDPETVKAVRCDGCADLVAAGELPACVMACPARALKFGDAGAMAALGERGATAPLPDPAETEPNYFMTPTADARAAGSSEGFIGNPLEVA
ncbi:4Fe-4S dicluster domain-containing protein [Adlercreutzia muris]|jgi:anaerobic dimethyl sulfoxide reductase subunit B (iron-sulfur subunit)|uniref:4Fe-4S dicluster domain-containing protein n=1 Tax=Adlercreutzia muris TaxID=1796610 RepID=UPI001365ED75|nr:4Fe-4S dicluster domain-containing protein [Adlercreutzia muris]MCI8306043.1 4Fe-4S dicluster domain-containing protein [Enterorhabdus sp.]NCA31503.1 4Fe-4S dicluster domain-containing protein [Adlercreutzia muris]